MIWRLTLRQLRRDPSGSATIVLSLGAAMAVCAAVFSFVNVLIFGQVPGLSDRQTLIRIAWTEPRGLLTAAEFDAFEHAPMRTIEGLGAQGDTVLPVQLPNGSEALASALVSAQFFETLGTAAVAGRLLTPADAATGATPVAVISADLWQRAFHGELSTIGRPVDIGGRSFTIVGVAPGRAPGLRPMDVGSRESDYPEVWLCLHDRAYWRTTASASRPWLSVAGRLSGKASLTAARAELVGLARAFGFTAPPDSHGALTVTRAGLDWRTDPVQALLATGLFLTLPLAVLGLACINVVNLRLARAFDNAGQMSLRLALGASRASVVRLLSGELVPLAILSGAVGWLGAHAILSRAQGFITVPLHVDGRVAIFLCVVVLSSIGIGGVLPAWLTTQDIVAAGLRQLESAAPMRTRMRSLLVGGQVAASVVLLTLSGLALRVVTAHSPTRPAHAKDMLVTNFDLADLGSKSVAPASFVEGVLDQLRRDPTVRRAAFATFGVVGRPIAYAEASRALAAPHVAFGGFVTAEWFDLMDVHLLAGRPPLAASRTDETTEVVVSASVAAQVRHGSAAALGVPLAIRQVGFPRDTVTIVGVVPDAATSGADAPVPLLYLPMPRTAFPAVFLFADAGDLVLAQQAVRRAVRAVGSTVPLGPLDSYDARVTDDWNGYPQVATFAFYLGGLGLVLAAAGLYALQAYSVRRRTREMGVRLAIGARRQDLVTLVLRQGLLVTVIGTLVGLGLAVPAARLMRAVFYGASAVDISSGFVTVTALCLVGVAASAIPAYRASRVDATVALRSD